MLDVSDDCIPYSLGYSLGLYLVVSSSLDFDIGEICPLTLPSHQRILESSTDHSDFDNNDSEMLIQSGWRQASFWQLHREIARVSKPWF